MDISLSRSRSTDKITANNILKLEQRIAELEATVAQNASPMSKLGRRGGGRTSSRVGYSARSHVSARSARSFASSLGPSASQVGGSEVSLGSELRATIRKAAEQEMASMRDALDQERKMRHESDKKIQQLRQQIKRLKGPQ